MVCVVAVRGFAFAGKVPLLRSSEMCFNDYPRAWALGFEKVSPLQGSFQSIGVNKMILWVHYRRIFFGDCFLLVGRIIGMGALKLEWV